MNTHIKPSDATPPFGKYTLVVAALVVTALAAMMVINAQSDTRRSLDGIRNAYVAGVSPAPIRTNLDR